MDFGISKQYSPGVGARAVTPGYSPIEQYGYGRTNQRSDIYALGATVYTLLTGYTPQRVWSGQLRDRLPAASHITPGLSEGMDAVLTSAMRMDKSIGFQTVAAFKQALLAPSPIGQAPRGEILSS